VLLAAAALLALTPAAQASFHLIKIREVFPGTTARPDSDYVELQMYMPGENLVHLGQLEVFNASGVSQGHFSPSGDVTNSVTQSTVVIADTEFGAQFPGVTADFSDSSLNLSPSGGAVCWPQTEEPFDDCASWGNFTGQASLPSTDTSPADPSGIPDGMAIRRSISPGCATLLESADDTNNSSVDFSSQTPNPRPNSVAPTESACAGAPDTVIDTKPPLRTNSTTAAFTFHSVPSGATFECNLDGGGFGVCPASYSGLAEKEHEFEVRAVSGATPDPSPATYRWAVDLTPPTTLIDTHPVDPSPGASAAFTFHASETSTFKCTLEGPKADGPAACSSGKTYVSLPDGTYTFKVEATDQAGNVQASPTAFSWTVDNSVTDTTPPETTIKSHPTDPTESTTAEFTYESNEPGSTFECALDTATFTSCPTTGIAYTGLAPGPHTFQVRATDPSNNTDLSPAGFSFTTVSIPIVVPPIVPPVIPPEPPGKPAPDTKLSPKPPAKTHDRTPTLKFKSTLGGSTFQCKIDGKPYKACRSPFTTPTLSFGRHTVKVRASAGGVSDTTPATVSFKVVK
jgi:hypothetical protein